ncbi:MAG: DNA/RNA nuclease SfsA [archaeon]|nr:DNA/RNA nuclease SfsA [archaeon]MCP8306838.1 DNA/RNA nuclease SfsA [archaeon]
MYIGEIQTLVSFIKIEGRTLKGLFQERPNRFLALVKVEDRILPSFLPNPGRMHELLTPRKEVLLREVLREKRRTSYDLIGVFHKGQTVSVDSRVPNRLVLEALKNRDIEELSEYNTIKPEYSYGHTRFDFLLVNGQEPCLLEVKSCTLVKDGVALFPDAKTERGRRHLRDLMKGKKEGYRACVLFIVQRTDALFFAPNDETDPEFGKVLRDATVKGVEVYAYYSEFIENKITLKGKVRVELEPHRDN